MPSLQLHQDEDAHLPLSKPLVSMKELKDWKASKATDTANIASVKLRRREQDDLNGPKLLLCHDMAGGYKEDQWIQGNNYDTIYNIQYWQYVDSFIYFSHERVTIPPVNWINTCHRNGVPCLGTFIVEGDQMGELEMLLHGPTDYPVLGDDDPMRLWNPYFADKLVAIAKHYGFDGWLMNIECSFVPFPTPVQNKAQQLTVFLEYFRNKLHEEIPGSTLIWYDSLTEDGKIDWQSQLNEKNLPFFKATDGIFLNYWWKDNYPKEAFDLAASIGRSGADVYFGTDVWGRGTHGGGEFQSYKGVEDSSKYGTSSALFAMAWTYEYFSKQNFDNIDRLFWKGGNPSEFPTLKDKDTKDVATLQDPDHHPGVGKNIRPCPGTSWFSSCFDRGYGDKFFLHGQALLEEPWSHLSHQNYPPNLSQFIAIDGNDAYNGGSSIILRCNPPHPAHADENEPRIPIISTMVYSLSLNIKSGTKLQLAYAYKPMPDAGDYTYSLKCVLRERVVVDGAEIHKSRYVDCAADDAKEMTPQDDGILITNTTTQPMNNGWMLRKVDFGFADPATCGSNSSDSTRTIDELGFMISHLSLHDQEKASCQEMIDLVRIGMTSLVPIVVEEKETMTVDDVTTSHRFNWKNVMWEEEPIHGDDDQALRFWGTLDWNWMNNRKSEELQQQELEQQNEQQKLIPEWCQTEYTLVYLTSTTMSNDDDDDDDIFLGTSFSTFFRISGADVLTDAAARKRVKIKTVDALGRIQASHTIDLPSITYYK
ncbi:glycosyl hydrolase family 85-domain-containing protein [Absidia repens]|uniref:Glycosyl hydrolase family 85-domain-containing protein n=1 Tax=Absidia repens TaxID=90262 RepID=A0A1X2IX30_9FUNG|nr:glycosyl hydrolase family 85-domain-containing protein [Absidia repens]